MTNCFVASRGYRETPLTIAIPKGRLQKRTEELLRSRGYHISFEDRKLVAEDSEGRIRVMLVKNSDLPTYVHHGIAGLGVCGTDVIYESGHRFFTLMEMPFGSTKMCLAGRADLDPDSDYFQGRGIPCEIIRLNGSVELAPVLGLTPYIVDLVETGSTLVANNLKWREIDSEDVKQLLVDALHAYRNPHEEDSLRVAV